jgi:ABC-type transport system substrate-binding protein
MAMNTKIYPTNITTVRQAIVHAINYTDLAQKAFLGHINPYVGPEYPAWKQFYDLGNFTPYQYNVTLAKQYLSKANITSLPSFTLTTTSGCQTCTLEAEVIQSDLAQIGITVSINVNQYGQYVSVYGSYSTNLANAAQIGQLSFVDAGESWAPYALTPADYWGTFVSNGSLFGNWAIYYNPVVQKCVDSFTSSSNITYIQSLCRQAQAQVYNDAPYYWVGVDGLWLPTGGSAVWNKNVIKSFLVDPTFTGADWVPFFNTVTFV